MILSKCNNIILVAQSRKMSKSFENCLLDFHSAVGIIQKLLNFRKRNCLFKWDSHWAHDYGKQFNAYTIM